LFFDSNVREITTLDMQEFLKNYNNPLSKKELNNWLKVLQDANLIKKGEIRGKPTTIPYSGRYSFDLYQLTETGYEINSKINTFLGKNPILNGQKKPVKTMHKVEKTSSFDEFDKIKKRYMEMAILKELENGMNSEILSEKTGIRHETLVKYIEDQIKSSPITLYQMKKKPLGIGKKMLAILGFETKKTYEIFIISEGQ
jgi:hypothetical protein